MRAAIYFTPPPDAAVSRLAAEWLGRDAFMGEATRSPEPAIDAFTSEPARYGFHATMKAPFRLAEGRDLAALDAALASFCADKAAPVIGTLALKRIDGFFALVPAAPEPALDALAAETVRVFEPFRAPLSADEIARRRPERLSARQRAHLDSWGYPFVFEDFRFHLTLTGRVTDEMGPDIEAALRTRFAPVLGQPLPIDGLAIFVEPEPSAPFTVYARHDLRIPSRTAQT